MGDKTSIQWCDSTVNPIMGCNGCELYPKASEVLRAIDMNVAAAGTHIDSEAMLQALVEEAFCRIESGGVNICL
jgi:protein gp37